MPAEEGLSLAYSLCCGHDDLCDAAARCRGVTISQDTMARMIESYGGIKLEMDQVLMLSELTFSS